MLELFDQVQAWAVDVAGSPWVLLVVLTFSILDGFFPPVPSEAFLVSAAALGAAGEGPNLVLLALVAATGAFLGDNIAYLIGRRIPLERIPVLNGDRGRRAVSRARRMLARRGAALILGARFVPFGRIAVNMTAGAVDYPRQRFFLLTGIAAVVWAGYSVGLGAGAGTALRDDPLLAAAAGVVGGVLLGVLLERILSWAQGRFLPDLTLPDDAGALAAGAPAAGVLDAGATDAGASDAGVSDADAPDVGTPGAPLP